MWLYDVFILKITHYINQNNKVFPFVCGVLFLISVDIDYVLPDKAVL